MNRQNGIAPILIVILIALAVGGYLFYQKQLKAYFLFPRTLTYEEVEGLIVNCQVYSIGQSHKDLEMGYLSINSRDVNGKENFFKVDKNYKPQINKKIEELTSSGKCPTVSYWIE